MDRVRVILKSGADFVLEAEEVTVTRNKLSGVLTEIGWVKPKDDARPAYIDLSEVAAVLWLPVADAAGGHFVNRSVRTECVGPIRGAPDSAWAVRESNPRPPACKAGALPAELTARTRVASDAVIALESRPLPDPPVQTVVTRAAGWRTGSRTDRACRAAASPDRATARGARGRSGRSFHLPSGRGCAEGLGRRLLGAVLLDLLVGVEEVLLAQVEPQREEVEQADRKRELMPLPAPVDGREHRVHDPVGKRSAHSGTPGLSRGPTTWRPYGRVEHPRQSGRI